MALTAMPWNRWLRPQECASQASRETALEHACATMASSMLTSRGTAAVLLAVTLVATNFQCMITCARNTCNTARATAGTSTADRPPCHHHRDAPGKQNPASCSQQPFLAGTAQTQVVQVSFPDACLAALPVPAVRCFRQLLFGNVLPPRATSPPSLAVLSSVILRI